MTPPQTFEDGVKLLVSKGWRVVSDGPTGVQMEKPKRPRMSARILFVAGAVVFLVVNWMVGAVILVAAIVDYAVLTKPESRFFPRAEP
jgi:hypothetical protein